MLLLFSSLCRKIDSSPEHFDTARADVKHTFITLFFAPWCGHCQKFKPEFSDASKKLEGIVDFHEVDCTATENQKLCSEYNVKGYPTIKLFNGINGDVDYEGSRTENDVIGFVMNNAIKPFELAKKSSDVEKFIQQSSIGDKSYFFILTPSARPSSLIYRLANKFNQSQFVVHSSFSDSLAEKLKETKIGDIVLPGVLNLIHIKGNKIVKYDGENTPSAIEDWVQHNV